MIIGTGGPEDLAFMYSSDALTLVSCDPELQKEFEVLKVTSLHEYVRARPDLDLEVYIDDADYYFAGSQVPSNRSLDVIELTREANEAQLLAFLNACDPADIDIADFELDSDFFYACLVEGEVAGVLASYCGVEPFESLSIIVRPEFRGREVGKALLARLLMEVRKRNRLVRYRTNVGNHSSIRLCESLEFTRHSRIQLLASI